MKTLEGNIKSRRPSEHPRQGATRQDCDTTTRAVVDNGQCFKLTLLKQQQRQQQLSNNNNNNNNRICGHRVGGAAPAISMIREHRDDKLEVDRFTTGAATIMMIGGANSSSSSNATEINSSSCSRGAGQSHESSYQEAATLINILRAGRRTSKKTKKKISYWPWGAALLLPLLVQVVVVVPLNAAVEQQSNGRHLDLNAHKQHQQQQQPQAQQADQGESDHSKSSDGDHLSAKLGPNVAHKQIAAIEVPSSTSHRVPRSKYPEKIDSDHYNPTELRPPAPQLTPEKDTIKENKDPSQKLSNHVEHNHRNRRDLNTVDEAISSLDTFRAPSAETNRPQTSATVATSSSLPSTSATTTSQMAESESASSNYLSYKPTVTLLSSSSSLSDGLATQGPIIVDSGNDALTSQREQHQFGNTNRLAQPPPSSSLQLNQNVNQTAGSEQEENSLVLLKLESTIQRYQQRLRLLEQFVKISTQKLYAVVKRVSDLEKCDCHIGCNWNNTRYSDGYTWQKDCDICTCNRGSVSCKHQVCEPSPCQELHHVRGQCCPVCYKTCKLNDITLKHGHKTIMSINNDTCKECICLDGRIKCHQVELIVSRAPMVVASNSTPQHQHPKHWQQNQSLLAPMNDLPNQNLLQQQHQHPHRHHVHNYLQSATHNSDTSDFDHQKHLICPPINCPIEDRFHLVNDCCTYCRNFDFCFHRGHQCHENAHCININNSFSCVCDNGFTGNGRYCHDIDECQDDSMNQCNKTTSICINTQGSYKCQCLPGYSDIASSSISSSSSSTGNISIASAGGHLYNYSNGKSTSHDQRNSDNNSNMLHLSAPTKHNHMVKQQESDLITSGNMDSTTTNDLAAVNIGGVCQDVNECATKELNNCDSNARCINKIGSFKCRCNRGYLGNGLECHKWITSADNVANYRHNHRKRKKKLMQNNHSLQSSSSHDRPKELASERDNTNYVNGIAVPETTDLDNSITVSTSSSRSSLTNNFRMPVLKPIDEDDDYDDTDDDENDNEEDDNDDDDEDNMTSEDQYEDGDDSYADKDQSNYISASTGLASSQQRKQQLQQQQQQKYRNEKVCRNEQGFESANCDKQEYGKDLNETLSGTQYLPLINSDNSESEVSSSLRPVISLTGSSYKFSPSNNHDIQASSTSLNTRTMFQQPRPEITTTQSTYTATNQQLDKLVIKDVDSVKDSNSNNKQLDQTQTNISDNDAQQLIAKSSAIKTNHVPADNLLINNNYDQHHETLSRVSNQPEAAKQSTVSNQASLVKQTSHSDINRRPQSSTIPRKGTIITSAGSSPNKYRPQSSATSGSSSYSSVSSLHRGFLNSKPPSLALIITVIQHHCLILLTTLFTIYNSFTTRLLLSTITS